MITQPSYACGTYTKYTDAEANGWGAIPNCSNVANDWLHPYFSTVFPSGITIGSNGRTLYFGCAKAVTNYLPATGTSTRLNAGNINNPKANNNPTYTSLPCGTLGAKYTNTLASKTLALALNIGFDQKYPNFSPSSTVTFGDLKYNAAPFNGWKFRDILTEANRLLGQGLINGQTNSYYTTMVSVINNILTGCNTTCAQNVSARLSDEEEVTENEVNFVPNTITLFPNPTSDVAYLKLNVGQDAQATIRIYDMKGALVHQVILDEQIPAGEKLFEIECRNWARGIYYVRCTIADELQVVKMVLTD